MSAWALEIDRKDIRKAHILPETPFPLSEGEIRVEIRRFALTANNITYAAFGDVMRYWDFFPATQEGQGRLPVWGFAEVTESTVEGLGIGERLYGYWPAGSHLVLQPVSITSSGFVDASSHRTELPAAYNRYIRCAGDAGYARELEGEQMVLMPLFLTSFLLARYLSDQNAFGAKRVLLTSASSKTAIALAWMLKHQPIEGVQVEALTSSGSRPFVDGLGFYADSHLYDDVATMDVEPSSIIVDFAGSAEVNRGLHSHLGDQLKANIRVGGAHWEESAPPSDLPGPKPVFFFAPDYMETTRKALGPGGFQSAYGEAWGQFAQGAKSWLTFKSFQGEAGCLDIYNRLIAGDPLAREGLIIELG